MIENIVALILTLGLVAAGLYVLVELVSVLFIILFEDFYRNELYPNDNGHSYRSRLRLFFKSLLSRIPFRP